MFTIVPADAILLESNGFASRHYDVADWWMTYEQFCRDLIKWGKTHDMPYEWLNHATVMGVNFRNMTDIGEPRRKLAQLFVNMKYKGREWLNDRGIRDWNDLSRPVAIHGWRPKLFPRRTWFMMQGRRFKGSPNSCHPKAQWVYGFALRFQEYRKRWEASIEYGYKHDSSSWTVCLEQNYRETLESFGQRLDAWIEKLLVPEGDWIYTPDRRVQAEKGWSDKKRALNGVFYFADRLYDEEENALTDAIAAIDAGGGLMDKHIKLTRPRYNTLKRWAVIDKKKKGK